MKVFYFGYYTKNANPNDFIEFPGCNVKMSYIIDSIKSSGVSLEVVCLGESLKKNNKKTLEVDDFEKNIFISTMPNRFLSKINLWLQVLYYLVFLVRRDDIVIFYHSLYLLPFFKFAKIIKNFRFILEVEESYYAAWGKSKKLINYEMQLLKGADSYIYVNDILPDLVDSKVPYVVCYGGYNYSSHIKSKCNLTKKIIYAGLISENMNSDVYLAINSVALLDENYKLHILGYGIDKAVEKMIDYIEEKKLSHKIFYDGFLTGNDYLAYLSGCDIALNPRMLENDLSNYTFPSKVLSYLSRSVSVVSTPIDCIQKSKIAALVSFSKSSTPNDFSKAIINIDYNIRSTDAIKELDISFIKDISRLLKK